MENSWKTASTIGTLLSTQVPVPMIPWVILQSKPIENSLDHLVEEMGEGQRIFCNFANVLEIRWNPHLLRFMSFINTSNCLDISDIPNIFCQPAIRLNRSHCPPDAVLLPASEQFYMTFNFQWWQPTLATLWVETPQIPQQLSVNTLMSTFSLILYCLEWTVTLYCHILSMASAQNTFCLIENQDNGKDCTGPCSKCRYMIGPSGH